MNPVETPILQAKHLNLYYGEKQALKDINTDIPHNEITALIGPSGCGKSTFLRTLNRMNDLVEGVKIEGEILFEGTDLLHGERSFLRGLQGNDISVVFQEPMTSLNPVYRIGWQVEEPLRIHHPELSAQERKQRALTLLKQVELEDPERIYQSYPHQISGGQRQRVMIAAAMICEPKLLIADEPTTALDVTVQSQIVKLLKRINQKKGTAILFISHDLSLVRRLCSRVIVMKDGRIVEQGAMEDIFENPQQEYTQKLIAAIPRCVKKNSGRSAKTEEAHG